MPTPVPGSTLRRGDHSCCFYSTEQEHHDVMAPYIQDGLARGERVLYFSDAHGDALATALTSLGVDVDRAIESGHLRLSLASDAYTPSGSMDADEMMARLLGEEESARSAGYPALRLAGDITESLVGLPQWPDYERRVNAFYATGYSLGVCLYRRDFLSMTSASVMLGAHPLVLTGGVRGSDDALRCDRLDDETGLRLTGELDHATVPLLASALAQHLDGIGDIVIDASGLAFVDAAGGRLLRRTARLLGDRRLAIASPQPMVLRVLSLLGVTDLPNVVVH